MLKELNHYENLGTPRFFHEIFSKIANPGTLWTPSNIDDYCHNKVIDGQLVFDGCVPFAKAVGAIVVSLDGVISLNPTLTASLVNEKFLTNKLLELVLVALKDDDVFHQIFCSEFISYDIIYRLIQIENTAFSLRYANFRQLLISFGFLYPHPDANIRKYIINSKYKRLFDKELMPEIKKRKIGIEQLEISLEQKRLYGMEAEVFVCQYERNRLVTHPTLRNVEIISEYDAGAGYDIVSYENEHSPSHDRFIEVKSFVGVPNFHWSRNEIDVSRIKRSQYFLYLVDRARINDTGYVPYIIQNPHEQIIVKTDRWDKSVDSYFIIQRSA